MNQQAPCPNCQQPLPQNVVFCPYCGVPIVPQADPYASQLETLPALRSDPNTPLGKLPLPHTEYGTEYDVNQQSMIPPPPPNPPVDFGTTQGGTIYPNSTNTQTKNRMPSNRVIVILLSVLVVLVLSGMIWWVVSNVRSAQINEDETATANAFASATVNASATAQVKSTNDALTATAVANQNPYSSTSGAPIQSDSLIQRSQNWEEYQFQKPTADGKLSYGSCKYENSGFTIATNTALYCPDQNQPNGMDSRNFTMSVKMKILQGDCGGVIFRDNGKQNYTNYRWYMCSNGNYYLEKGNSDNSTIKHGSSYAIKAGDVLAVGLAVKGDSFSLYINDSKSPVAEFTDTTNPYEASDIGLVAGSLDLTYQRETSVVFNDVKIWSPS